MHETFTIAAVFMIGFFHAFEMDHLAAVSTIVTKRKTLLSAIKDGIFWGLGHTSTIFLVGMALIFLKLSFDAQLFSDFEGIVGLMLIGIGGFRMYQLFYKNGHEHGHDVDDEHHHSHSHKLAYGVGLIHGLAGSGSIVLLVISKVHNSWNSMLFLMIFGVGSILGMLVAAGIFSLPFSKKITKNQYLRKGLVVLSSLICISIGGILFYENLL